MTRFQKYILSLGFALTVFLAFPFIVQASTFTVDSTGDGADAAIDGLCATSGAVCTLRAAIAEANATAGPHTINFNIPTSDTGCRDFDTESTLSSCDGVGGDDFWTINPATVLPTITATGVTIDGASQTTNQGDTNTSGPEIQINGTTAGEVRGLVFSGTNGSVNSLIINRFGSALAAIEVTADGFTITNSYLGPFAKGLTGDTTTNRSGYGLYLNVASATVGTTTSNGNIFAGNNLAGVYATCGTGGSGKNISIAGNKFGLGVDGSTQLLNGSAGAGEATPTGNAGLFLVNDCLATVGGSLAANRNYFAGGRYGIVTNLGTSDIPRVQIYNNFFGTDTAGTANRALTWGIHNIGSVHTNDVITLQIGDTGKGNLFRFNTIHVRMITSRREFIAAYNTFADSGDHGFHIGTTAITLNITKIHHNHFGVGNPDPYFGLTTGPNTNTFLNIQGNTTGIEVYENDFYGGVCTHWSCAHVLIGMGTGSSFHDNYSQDATSSGISAASLVADALIEDNTVINFGGAAFGGNGIQLSGLGIVRNNIIDGGTPHGEFEWGIYSLGAGTSTIIENNQVSNVAGSGITARDGFRTITNNTINNAGYGIFRENSPATTGVKFQQNIITNIVNLPVDLSHNLVHDGRSLNDPGDADTGTANRMNFPVIQSIEYLGSGVYRVNGRLDGNTAEDPFEIELCLADDNVTGNGGCAEFFDIITTASTPDEVSGASNYYNWTTDVTVTGSNGLDDRQFTALATNSLNHTSEFADNFDADSSNINYQLTVYEELPTVSPLTGETVTDSTPLLDWEVPTDENFDNSELDHYDVILDDVVIASPDNTATEYQLTSPLADGEHTWRVIAYWGNDEIMAASDEESFTVDLPAATPMVEEQISYTFKLLDPINEAIVEDTTPLFDWEDIDAESEFDIYELYINNKFAASGIIESQYQLPEEKALNQGIYVWQVIAYKNVNNQYEVLGRSNIEDFNVNIPTTELTETPTPTEMAKPTTSVAEPTEEVKELPWTGNIQGKETIIALVIATVVGGGSLLWLAGYLGWIPFLDFLKKKRSEVGHKKTVQ